MNRPTIAITMGDPAGIGPEIIMKALGQSVVHEMCRPFVVGDASRLRQAASILAMDLPVIALQSPECIDFNPRAVHCVDLNIVADSLPFGKVSAQAGRPHFAISRRRWPSSRPAPHKPYARPRYQRKLFMLQGTNIPAIRNCSPISPAPPKSR